MAKLTDRQRKNIIAASVEGVSVRALAKKYNVSTTTIQNIKKSDTELVQKLTQKKDARAKSVLAHMDEKADIICDIIDEYLKELMNLERIKKSSTKEIATVLGIIIDKFVGGNNKSSPADEEKQANFIKAIEEAVKGGNK